MKVIDFQGVSKSYPIYESPGQRLKELATFNRVSFHRDFWAVRDVSFDVKKGETFCIIGENGSGKSTLLQMVAGILQPSSGSAAVNGRVSALLELGSGFNPEFSGKENVYLNAAILGLSTAEIDARYAEIEAFAEIGFTFVGLHTEVERGNEFLEYEDVEGRLLYITRYNGNKYDMMADCEEWTDALIDQIRPIAELKRKEMGWGE